MHDQVPSYVRTLHPHIVTMEQIFHKRILILHQIIHHGFIPEDELKTTVHFLAFCSCVQKPFWNRGVEHNLVNNLRYLILQLWPTGVHLIMVSVVTSRDEFLVQV